MTTRFLLMVSVALAGLSASAPLAGVPSRTRTCVTERCLGLRGDAGRLCKRVCRCAEHADPNCPTTVRLTLLHLNDLHAHLVPHLDLVPDGPDGEPAPRTRVVERGGLVRLATLVRAARAENPNTLLLNVGDTYHGGVEALFTNGNAIVPPVEALGIDVGVPGNWDFAYGPIVTRARYGAASSPDVLRPGFPNLAANVTYAAPDPRAGEPLLPATLVRDVGGVRIGVIGITSDIVRYMHPVLASGLTFLEGERAYRELIDGHARALRDDDGADVVIVMSELGIQKDYRLAHLIAPGSVDVFFSAHTHEAVYAPLLARSGALVVEAGNDGYLGQMDVLVANGRVVGRAWALKPITRDVPEDAAMQALVTAARAPFLAPDVQLTVPNPLVRQALDQPIDTVIGQTTGLLHRRHALESSFNAVFANLLRQEAATEVAITPGFRFDTVVPDAGALLEADAVATGAITIEDAYRFFPVVYSLATATATAARLREVVEEALADVYSHDPRRRCWYRGNPAQPLPRRCRARPGEPDPTAGAFRQRGGWFLGLSGLEVIVDLAAPDGARVHELRRAGDDAPIDPSTVLTVTGCTRPLDVEGQLCGYDGFTSVRPFADASSGAAWTPVDFLAHVLASTTLEPTAGPSVRDLSGADAWPSAPFVQPLTAPNEGGRRQRP